VDVDAKKLKSYTALAVAQIAPCINQRGVEMNQLPISCSGCKSLKKRETKTFNGRWELIKVEFDFHYCGDGMKHRLTPNEVLIKRPNFCPRDNDYLHSERASLRLNEEAA
jgi:uncharacterized lipoprotein YehR (DUF1307 family)